MTSESKEKKKKIQRKEYEFDMYLEGNYKFHITFDLPNVPEFLMDEPPEIGGDGAGPNAARVVAAGVGDCLSASLIFCLRKMKIPIKDFRTHVKAVVERNTEGLLRLSHIYVTIKPKIGKEYEKKNLERCMNIFQKYCIVSDAIRHGVPIDVEVIPEEEA